MQGKSQQRCLVAWLVQIWHATFISSWLRGDAPKQQWGTDRR